MAVFSVPLRTGVGGVIAAALLMGVATPALATPAADAPVSYLETSPVELSHHDATAQYVQAGVGGSSFARDTNFGVQAVNEPDSGKTSLEMFGIFDSKVTSSVDLSQEFSHITSVSLFSDDNADYAMRAIVQGQRNGAEHLAMVISSSTNSFQDISVRSLDDVAALDVPTLRDLEPAGSGLLAVNETSAGTYVASRLTFDLQPVGGRPPVLLGLSHATSVFVDGDAGDIYGVTTGAVQQVSVYEPSTVRNISLPNFGALKQFTPLTGRVLLADENNNVALVNSGSASVSAQITLPRAGANAVFNPGLEEILVASADGHTIWRYAKDGTPRTAVELGDLALLPGSLSSLTSGWTTHTFTAAASGKAYRYEIHHIARVQFVDVQRPQAANRNSGVNFSVAGLGSSLPGAAEDYWWEYSLDGGANWAKENQTWDKALADKGNFNLPRPTLPAPMDGVAPFLRLDVTADGPMGISTSASANEATIPEGTYDALWRARFENDGGSVATEPQKIEFTSTEVDPRPHFTQHPAARTVSVGQDAKFDVGVEGDPKPTVTWQIKRAGKDWETLEGTGTEVHFTAQLDDDKAEIRATAVSGEDTVTSQTARVTVIAAEAPKIGAAPQGAKQLDNAAFNWQLNKYSHEWARDVFGAGAVEGKKEGFDFSGGTGWTVEKTGATQILWQGVATYRPYGGMNGLNLSFANPYLAIDADGRGTLTADVFWNNGGGMGGSGASGTSGGFHRVVIATYADAQARTDGGKLAFTATPEWDHRPYVAPGLDDTQEYASSFPASFLDYLDRGLRPWFLPTGNRNQEKAGIAISGSATVNNTAASTDGTVLSATDPLGDGAQHFADALPKITEQPAGISGIAGESVNVMARATGIPAPRVVWQRNVGGNWVNIEGANATTLQLVDLVEGSYTVRAEFSNRMGKVTTKPATINVVAKAKPGVILPEPTTDPKPPVAEGADLTDAQRGDAHFAQTGASVVVTGLEPGEWYFVTMYSEPHGLGWVRADDKGRVVVTLPNADKAEAHRITLQDADGDLAGWTDVRIGSDPDNGHSGGGNTGGGKPGGEHGGKPGGGGNGGTTGGHGGTGGGHTGGGNTAGGHGTSAGNNTGTHAGGGDQGAGVSTDQNGGSDPAAHAVTGAALANTGAAVNQLWVLLAGLLAAGATVMTVRFTRKRKAA